MYYSEKVVNKFLNLENVGIVKNPSAVSEIKTDCGDVVKVYIKIVNNKIVDAKFKAFGSPSVFYIFDYLTMFLRDKSLEDIRVLKKEEVIKESKEVDEFVLESYFSVLKKEVSLLLVDFEKREIKKERLKLKNEKNSIVRERNNKINIENKENKIENFSTNSKSTEIAVEELNLKDNKKEIAIKENNVVSNQIKKDELNYRKDEKIDLLDKKEYSSFLSSISQESSFVVSKVVKTTTESSISSRTITRDEQKETKKSIDKILNGSKKANE